VAEIFAVIVSGLPGPTQRHGQAPDRAVLSFAVSLLAIWLIRLPSTALQGLHASGPEQTLP